MCQSCRGGASDGLEAVARGAPREGAEGDGRRIGPESRQADYFGRLASRLRQDRRADQAADLALVGRHIVGRVALGVLDVAEALAMSEADIVRRDVVLEVHEALAASPDFPQRFEGERGRLVFRQGAIGVSRKAREARRLASGGEAVARRRRQSRTRPAPLRPSAPLEPETPGIGLASSALHAVFAPDWLARSTFGFQPPETHSRSASTVSAFPPSPRRWTSTRRPSKPATSQASRTSRPPASGPFARASITTTRSSPASFRARAAA